MTANDIIKMLSRRHQQDVFYTEINIDGGGTPRLDAWALKPSYTNALTFGYEIKTSRSDFLNDNKMHQYEPYCRQLYLVTTRNVCTLDEIPENYGWLVVAGSRLVTKKKAKTRDVSIPESFYQSLLVNTSRGKGLGRYELEIKRRVERINDFEAYVEGKKDLSKLGEHVGYLIANERAETLYEKKKIEEWKEKGIEEFIYKFNTVFGLRINWVLDENSVDEAIEMTKEKFDVLTNSKIKIKESLEQTILRCKNMIARLDND